MGSPGEKKERLLSLLKDQGPLCVAFSGGVDSALLCAAAKEALGADRVLAVTVVSLLMAARERETARRVAGELGIAHVEVVQDDLINPGIAANTPERCYFCKKSHLAAIAAAARERGFAALAHGANLDDRGDFRPGLAAAREAGVPAPLAEAGLLKKEIRALAREMGISVWDKPSSACLASRIPFGTPLTKEALARVEAAEDFLFSLGLSGFRVRHFGAVAVVEAAPEDLTRFADPGFRERAAEGVRRAGFSRVALDLAPYRQGSLNPESDDSH
ncbi:MAG: ATP-dependent sacrificial sulfur transferase LarE [Thermodesulfobacteriota bacterium]